MSILTDFLSTYKPVQVIKLPLSSYLYKSDAVSGLASTVSDLSAILSDYETHEELSTSVYTNELSAGVLSVGTSILSVEHIAGYDILNINGTRFYNISGKQVIQSVLPRHELDARITVFKDPLTDHYFKLVALVDDKSMIDPDADVNMNIDVVRINPSEIDPNKDEIYERVYIRVPGENERHSVNYLYIGYSSDGQPRIEASYSVEDLNFKLGQVVDGIFFTGDSIQTNGDYAPERILASYDGERHLWLLPDSEYSQRIAEDEMRFFDAKTNERVNAIVLSVNNIDADISAFKDAVADEINNIYDLTAELSVNTLSSFEAVERKFDAVESKFVDVATDIAAVDSKADAINEFAIALSNQLTSNVSRLDSEISFIRNSIENLSERIDQNTTVIQSLVNKLSAIALLSNDCTIEDQRLTINGVISASYNLLS